MSQANTADRTRAHVKIDAALRRIDKMRFELNHLCAELHVARRSVKRRPAPLSIEQIREVIRLIGREPNNDDLLDIVRIVSNTGLRRGELETLRWTDIDLAERRIRISSETCDRIRYVPFGPDLAQVLEARLHRHPESEFVLGDRAKRVLASQARRLRRIADDHGIGVVNFCLLRWTFFIRLYRSGASAIAVAKIAGWTSLDWLVHEMPSRSNLVATAEAEPPFEEV